MIKSGWYNDNSKESSGFRFDRVEGRVVGTMYAHNGSGGTVWFELQSVDGDPTLLKAYQHVGQGYPFADESVSSEVGFLRLSNVTETSADCYWQISRMAFLQGQVLPSPLPAGYLSGELSLSLLFNGE